MTYCVGMMLDKGLVLMSDTRTNSGVDNISVFRKMHYWNVPGERLVAVMTAGNLATTQAVVSKLEERTQDPGRPAEHIAGSRNDVPGGNDRGQTAARHHPGRAQEQWPTGRLYI